MRAYLPAAVRLLPHRLTLCPMAEIRLARSDDEIRACYPIMSQLRSHVGREEFLKHVRRQADEGYRLAFLEIDGRPATVAGYRILHQLVAGKVLYVDDLVTDEALRSGGLGARMLEWLLSEARRAGCRSFELDSATHRTPAHRLYRRQGMDATSLHFRKPVR